jgi:hypothetical protein
MSQILSLEHSIEFKSGSSFSERESLINNEILKIQDTLRQRGFYPLEHTILNKNDKLVRLVVTYKV